MLDALPALNIVRAYQRCSFERLGVQPEASILDLGCGTGVDAQERTRLIGPSGGVVGVDRSETVIAEARERVLGTTLCRSPGKLTVGLPGSSGAGSGAVWPFLGRKRLRLAAASIRVPSTVKCSSESKPGPRLPAPRQSLLWGRFRDETRRAVG